MTTTPTLDIHEQLNKIQNNDNYEAGKCLEPIISLPLVKHLTFEEDEDEMIKMRAKLYRFDISESPSVWKERGTGEVKLLYHSVKHTVRVVMRRDKTLKICANHFITPSMKLQRPSNNRKNWWIWSVSADYADEITRPEIFAIKFTTEENANVWEKKFIEGQNLIQNENMISQTSVKKESKKLKDSDESSESETEVFEDALDKLHVDTN